MTSPDEATPAAELTFADLQIHPSVLQAVTDVGYESPSAIQAATIPPMLAGSDVVGLAQTGTGKTAAFAIPILSKIDAASKNTQALVLAPTRELALQVAEAFGRYGAHLPGIQVLPIYGGSSYGPQLAGLRRGAQIVVGTPGRVIDHLEKGSLDLSHLDYLVLDEADEMLQMGFAEDVERILADTPEYKQVALFSATMPPAIKKITSKYLHDPVEVTVKSKTQTAENITQRYLQVSYPQPFDPAIIDRQMARWGDEVLQHQEFARMHGDWATFAILLVRWTTAERQAELIREIEADGCTVFNPHVVTIEDGGMKTIDDAQIAFKRRADPMGLMNPGKTRGWHPSMAR